MSYLIKNGFWVRDRVNGYNYLYPSLKIACERAWHKQQTATHVNQFAVRFLSEQICPSDYASLEVFLQVCLDKVDKLHAA